MKLQCFCFVFCFFNRKNATGGMGYARGSQPVVRVSVRLLMHIILQMKTFWSSIQVVWMINNRFLQGTQKFNMVNASFGPLIGSQGPTCLYVVDKPFVVQGPFQGFQGWEIVWELFQNYRNSESRNFNLSGWDRRTRKSIIFIFHSKIGL